MQVIIMRDSILRSLERSKMKSSAEEKIQKRKIMILAGGGTVILLLILIFIGIIMSKPNATLDILVTPLSAKILINDEEYSNGTYNLEPGEIMAVISKDGFTSQEIKLDLVEGETTKLYTYLLPADGSFDWYLNHEEDMMVLNTIGDAIAYEEGMSYIEKNPIIEILPIIYADYDKNWNYTEFRVDGGKFDKCEKAFCLKITDTTGGNYEAALGLIREKGFDPEDFEIIYEYKPITPLE